MTTKEVQKIDTLIAANPAAATVKTKKATTKKVDEAKAATDLKGIYAIAKPILVVAIGLLFFKPKWQTVLQNLLDGLDAAIK